ncbi:MAG: hypothetical protein NVSMB51_10220 [Solirubrobacteraceae bacterium]
MRSPTQTVHSTIRSRTLRIINGVSDVPIKGETITLGQLLKFAGLCDSGADAKLLLAEGAVLVNGLAEHRRGRKLHAGDIVEAAGEQLRVA